MGGGQLFVLRRAKHLKNKGYAVSIVVTTKSPYFPLKNQFHEFPIYVIPEMGYRVSQYSEKKVRQTIDDLLENIEYEDSLLIESHTLSTIEWGEHVAAASRAKHLAYPLAEPSISKYRFNPGIQIFNRKLQNGEFYGCTSSSLKYIFGRDVMPNRYINIGYDEKEMFDQCVPSLQYKKSKGDFVISTVTRLDKTYVEHLVTNTVGLAKKYPNHNFILLIAGGSSSSEREKFLMDNFNNSNFNEKNLRIVYTGYIEKLGRDLFDITDVFVGMGTAVINAISQSCLTVVIDACFNTKVAGFLGKDTNNFAYSISGKTYSIFEKLEEAFLLKDSVRIELQEKGRKLFEEEFEINRCFKKMDDIIYSLSPVDKNSIKTINPFYRCFVRLALFAYHIFR